MKQKTKFRWKKVLWLVLPFVIPVAGFKLYLVLNPDATATVKCVIQRADGELIKEAGADCENLEPGDQAVVLKKRD
ncbi:hypothetical protein [Pseudanabaena sp. FACHB-2040]|uniref:hypothetical protein n=1 Tax=Pseudanabaena sp. FACHB-2040 TaxID=2692859 RepID=UPI00168773E5|nr:hypothetical protein [Pseudanabaena sp. FACHB-2040]MBD2256636.1 hypothetical protein [Pseudanabaena sp. FACHB-2040]